MYPPPMNTRLIPLDTLRIIWQRFDTRWREAMVAHSDIVDRLRAGERINQEQVDAAWEEYVAANGERKGLQTLLDACGINRVDLI
jgi:hypothetical protein